MKKREPVSITLDPDIINVLRQESNDSELGMSLSRQIEIMLKRGIMLDGRLRERYQSLQSEA